MNSKIPSDCQGIVTVIKSLMRIYRSVSIINAFRKP